MICQLDHREGTEKLALICWKHRQIPQKSEMGGKNTPPSPSLCQALGRCELAGVCCTFSVLFRRTSRGPWFGRSWVILVGYQWSAALYEYETGDPVLAGGVSESLGGLGSLVTRPLMVWYCFHFSEHTALPVNFRSEGCYALGATHR